MLEVEDWTQPTSPKRRISSRRVASEPRTDTLSPPPLTPPSDNQVEETFPEARGPNSHLFSSRSRSNSTPAAGPSSLSRLLAQAPISDSAPAPSALETIQHSPVDTRTPSPIATPFVPPPASPPSQLPPPLTDSPLPILIPLPFPTTPPSATPASASNISSPPHADPTSRKQGSPLRPGSRASRISTTSRLSSGRIPPFQNGSSGPSTVKGTPTTALTPVAMSPPAEAIPPPASTPMLAESPGEGLMSSVLGPRRRTASYHTNAERQQQQQSASNRRATNASSPGISALASLASWGSSLSRRRRAIAPAATVTTATTMEGVGEQGLPSSASARELLSRLDETGKP